MSWASTNRVLTPDNPGVITTSTLEPVTSPPCPSRVYQRYPVTFPVSPDEGVNRKPPGALGSPCGTHGSPQGEYSTRTGDFWVAARENAVTCGALAASESTVK